MDSAFLRNQRKRLLGRLQSYPNQIQNGNLPAQLAAHKAHMAGEIIPVVLKRIEDGVYGICVDCGEGIPQRRLEIIPAALRCVDCQNAKQK